MLKVSAASVDVKNLSKCVVLFATKGATLAPESAKFDKAHGGLVSKALKKSRFQGDAESTFSFATPSLDKVDSVVVVGLGVLLTKGVEGVFLFRPEVGDTDIIAFCLRPFTLIQID